MNLEDVADREQAETVACDHCGAQPGTTCVRPDGQPLQNVPAHTPRIAAAGIIHAPIDSREIRSPGRPARRWSRPADAPRSGRTRR